MRCALEFREFLTIVGELLECKYFNVQSYVNDQAAAQKGTMPIRTVNSRKRALLRAATKISTQGILLQKILVDTFKVPSVATHYRLPCFTDRRGITACINLVRCVIRDVITTVNQLNPCAPHARRMLELAKGVESIDSCLRV